MLPMDVYRDRMDNHCSVCEWWNKSRCRKGHLPTSPTGCPVMKFEPILGAGYDDDREPDPESVTMSCCGNRDDMPDLSWAQVLALFSQSMVRWIRSGLAIAPDRVHADRLRKCEKCPLRQNFWCKKCKCVCYLKAKLASESCPDGKWLSITQ